MQSAMEQAKIGPVGANGLPELIWADNMKRSEIRDAVRIATGQQAYLLA
jgi:hypothetical protein